MPPMPCATSWCRGPERLAPKGEHMAFVLAHLPLEHSHGEIVEWDP